MKVFRDRLGGEEHNFFKRMDPILNVPTVADQQMDRIHHALHTLSGTVKSDESPGMIPAAPASMVLSCQNFKQSSEANNDDQAQWYVVTYVKFKAGAALEARQIISRHFWPVDPPLTKNTLSFDFHVGEWDHAVYFPMNGGASQLVWMPGPMMASWVEKFYRREGGKDNGDAICRRYNELVERCKVELAVATF